MSSSGAAPPGRVDFVRWDGLYHEMFNEPERDQVFERPQHEYTRALLAAMGEEPVAS